MAGNDIYFSYTYDYGNGDFYQGYGYGDSSLGYYNSGQYLYYYPNETSDYGYYSIDSVYDYGYDTGYSGSNTNIYVSSYYDGGGDYDGVDSPSYD
nr:hypothetical protein [Microcystis aeruginosa K13-06]